MRSILKCGLCVVKSNLQYNGHASVVLGGGGGRGLLGGGGLFGGGLGDAEGLHALV